MRDCKGLFALIFLLVDIEARFISAESEARIITVNKSFIDIS